MPVKDFTIKINGKEYRSYSQVCQDLFALYINDNKFKGTYLEIGSNHPMINNNTYKLYKEYNWNGIMVEYDEQYLELYKQIRPRDTHIIKDARTVDYRALLMGQKVIDYLSIDLEVGNGSTLEVLQKLESTVFPEYKFRAITFEHDIYMDKEIYHKTRKESREIFERNGYRLIFPDVCDYRLPFEDWYIHPEVVDNVEKLIENSKNYNFKIDEYHYLHYTDVIKTLLS